MTEIAAKEEEAAAVEIDERTTKQVALGAFVGTALEWYDFFLFTTASAIVFNVQFFVSDNALVASLAAFGTLAVGFVARPLGGLIFGAMGDKVGRKKVLMITIVGIGAVTGLIGLLPNYFSIGIAAPIILILLRFAQGLAVGGEWSGAMIIAIENAPLAKRSRYAAVPQLGSPVATILSSGGFFLLALSMSKSDFDSFGWRIPFLIAIPLLLVSLWIRRKLEESPVFSQVMEHGETESAPIKQVLKTFFPQIIVGMATTLLGVGGFYLVTTFVISYGVRVLHLDSKLFLLATLLAAVVEIPVLIYAGRLGEKIGASKVAVIGGALTAVLAYPVFMAIESKDPVLVVLAIIIGVSALSIPYAISGVILTGLFPVHLRYTGVAIAANTAGLVSGFVPLIATAFLAASGDQIWPAILILVAVALFTLVAGLLVPRLSIPVKGLKH
ncbi:MFS transporter [Arthrobacter celericrescens]|uniref:MFS transporter n=1 Tax=Arthrobacter celericrescens TaxID=2320851 RepID=UPI000EA2273A|nr:MFS transporter [Arthrobacter celericrescens]